MRMRFLPPARRELLRAAVWFDRQSAGLGDRFLDDVRQGISGIKEFPSAHPPIGGPYRRYLLAKFPDALIYRKDSFADDIVIVAVAHLSRRPDYWRQRNRQM
jgi:toxin ParE2